MLNDDEEIIIERPRLTQYQKDILYCTERYSVTEAATKIGKTFPHLWWLFEEASTPPKPGANYWWIAPVYGQTEIAFNRLRRFLGGSSDFRINLSKLYIETPVESFIHFKSAEKPDNLYGEDVFAAVFDEFTRAREEAWVALRSTLTATRGKCKFIGNTKGKKNWGYRLGLKARSGEPGYKYFKINAYDAIKGGATWITLEEIEQAKRDLPESAFRELYMAETLDDQSNPFGIQFIQKRVKPISNKRTVCYGIDLAKSIDWTVVTGLDDNGDISYFDRWQSDWGQTRRRIIQTIGSTPTAIDSTGVGDPIVEDIQRECGNVEGYHYSSSSKQKLMEGLANAIQKGTISVLDGIMKDELEAFEFIYGRTGVRYSAPEGVHDDTVNSLALANHKLSQGISSGVNASFF
jgi:hypothetical protein